MGDDGKGYFANQGMIKDIGGRDGGEISYIILQNDALHSRLDRMERRLREAERERDRAVEDCDRRDRVNTCLRGLVHNEIEATAAARDLASLLDARCRWVYRSVSAAAAGVSVACYSVYAAHALLGLIDDSSAWGMVAAVHAAGLAAASSAVMIQDRRVTAARSALAQATHASSTVHSLVDEI